MATKQAEAVLEEEEIDQIADEIVEEIEKELKLKEDKKSVKSEVSSNKKKKTEGDHPDEEEEMEEGELPPALKKAIAAKKKKDGDSDDDEDEEKDEEKKKAVKEAAVAAPELPKTKHEMMRNIFTQMQGTNKKQLSDAYTRLMGSLLGEEEDEEEEEQASSKGKKVSEKRKIITKEDIDVTDDLNALFGDNDLSEEFKTQTQTIFEAAVVAKINTELELLESNYAEMLENAKEEILSEVTDKVDSYLGYVVEEWVKDNELSVERGLKTEITEEFIGGLKSLFEEHYIDVP
ncbi:MAG TPA: hypothetical protein EYN69_04965, partial [Flavobacteriales bacterium]|nr:hypothetical protein [Flavobacteriales bacterium]